MARYLMTHSLLSSWLYAMSDNPYSDATNEKPPLEEFLQVLRREPTETTEAMQKGINFENLVTQIVQTGELVQNPWTEAARWVAQRVHGGLLQYVAKREDTIGGIDVLMYGRLDALKAGHIYDIKFSGSYESGKFFDSTQHPMYLYLVPEAKAFTYLVSNGTNCWEETYRRDETEDIRSYVAQFFDWLKEQGMFGIYKEHWSTK